MKFARIIDGIAGEVMDKNPAGIHNPTVAALFSECPDEVKPGWVLADGVWSAPEPVIIEPEPEEQPTTFSPYSFMCLVGDANMAGILSAAKTDTIVELMVKKVDSAEVIDFDDEVRGPKLGLQYLVSQDLISQSEYERIMRREFP